jgi:alpha-D-xyloside xylohydrolase
MKRHWEIYIIVYLFTCGAVARLTTAAPLPVRSFQKDASGVTMKLGTGLLRLEVCDNRTIHVTSSPSGKLPEKKELIVIRQWKPAHFRWSEDSSQFILRTA